MELVRRYTAIVGATESGLDEVDLAWHEFLQVVRESREADLKVVVSLGASEKEPQ